MVTAHRAKSTNKQAGLKKLVAYLKKRYKNPAQRRELPILETMLFAICVENAAVEEAEASYARLFSSFHDLNEVRVSSISELATVFQDDPAPEMKALRLRSTLQYVFEKNFAFDFESLRRKSLDLAGKQLLKIKELSPFVRSFTLQAALGGHIVPLDDLMFGAAAWLGLVDAESNPAKASEDLKSLVRKNDTEQFCALLRSLATDRAVRKTFEPDKLRSSDGRFDLGSAPERLAELFSASSRKGGARPKKGTKRAAAAESHTRGRKRTTTRKTATKSPRKTDGHKAASHTTTRKKK